MHHAAILATMRSYTEQSQIGLHSWSECQNPPVRIYEVSAHICINALVYETKPVNTAKEPET